ncbi:MAG: hypothetical protein JSW37_00080 [Anaerolineales bacterium]|jgi:hypothetical protein|nr:MAG: hypothetical protein JSW37_00080 [Anaerolineales bacterium]
MLDTIARFVRTNWTVLILMTGLLAAWFLLRMRSTDLASIEQFDQLTKMGQPALVVLFSNT